MRRAFAGDKRRVRLVRPGAYGLALLIGLGTAPGRAEDSAHPVDSALKMLNLKADPGTVPDFVAASRSKGATDYMPVGQQHPTRPVKIKSPAELKAAEAELDAARIHQDVISGRKQPADPVGTSKKSKPVKSKAAVPAPVATGN